MFIYHYICLYLPSTARLNNTNAILIFTHRERERLALLQLEVGQLKTSNEELVNDMAGCREREADMLEFTQKVTAKNVRLQSEYSCIEAKVTIMLINCLIVSYCSISPNPMGLCIVLFRRVPPHLVLQIGICDSNLR